jgi:predicted nucleic acid-binding protein
LTVVVLDASVVAAWYLDGQATASADLLLRQAAELEFAAPHIFSVEVLNLLLVAERRGRIRQARTEELLEGLDRLQIQVREPLEARRRQTVLALARREGLTAYDALYLDLAISDGAELASRDGALLAAAQAQSVIIRDLRR